MKNKAVLSPIQDYNLYYKTYNNSNNTHNV